ncbi:hypothetical protein SV7mr_52850 [Stieleria bergensis]|uniref:Uncharacterized protein n=1 Tax=Stieleria bergensis TaxID=2528025 RepID=A0A517T2Y2_9BACT|nr:hypothetical protein SV7mr_52850 [Planctomycetes bacterium SV_7m_r]
MFPVVQVLSSCGGGLKSWSGFHGIGDLVRECEKLCRSFSRREQVQWVRDESRDWVSL